MYVSTFALLARYNRETNAEMNGFIRQLDDGQWNREFKGYFNSVKALCNHLYISDFTWLKRFSGLRDFLYIKSPLFREDVRFGTVVLEGVEDYIEKRERLDEMIVRFTSEIVPADFDRLLSFTDSHGVSHEKPFGGLVLHFFNHQTHHRGMISLYLEHMDIANDYSSLMNLL